MAGAQGGSTPTNYEGGAGAKASGYINLKAGEKLYFYVGGEGISGKVAEIATYQGGYNGGGNGYVSRAGYTQTAASGGGGGYYGGASGVWQPGAGGSSYISGYAGVNSVENNTTITHTNQTIHYSGKYFIGGEMLEGQNSGDGYAKISFVDTKPKKKY